VVFAGGNFFTPPDSIAKLRSLGLTVVVLYAPSVDTVYKDIDLIGQALPWTVGLLLTSTLLTLLLVP
jgi:ABC-type Fe3+-hydroxamate transport system substrate-binding protein